ncbi:Peptidoglycan-binding protein, CsiV [Marinospirillum celere]|uniref:Peptidoglycan-binding protein, CsiV n=1 Tax=Marinospirillum celere TaxID=1122252 RepID=A0A1I1E787_9GAMM|nr:CsiV family protein [Marinospirillum celere]SFB82944.1 Peptidoglycan-binding protein, CsiV [Marinospirillum celere]
MRLILLLVALIGMLLPWQAVVADELDELVPHRNERDYIIEVLIFSQQPGSGATELPGPPKIFQPLETAAYMVGPSPYWARLNQGPLQLYQPRELQLNRQARALERSSDYRLLFHDAWQMHVVGEDRSVPLLIEAGDYYGGQPELLGQLKLSVARYLHLETDLYLHTFEPLAQQPGSSALNQLLIQNRSSLEHQDSLSKHLSGRLADDQESASPLMTGQQFQIKESAQMKQRRRMRSGELHFIDSPYLGLLIRIERAPEEDTANEAER